MKILYLAAESANWVISLCNEFCKEGHEVTCVVQESDEYDKEHPVEMHENLTRINVPMEYFFNSTKMKSALLPQITLNSYDIVFGSHAPVSQSVKDIAAIFKAPWGVMLLDIPHDLMVTDRNRLLQWMYWFETLKYATTIIFNTKVARDVYFEYTKQFFGDDNIITYATAFKEKYKNAGKDVDENYVLSICRLTPMKAVSSITRALALLKNPPTQMVIGRDRGDLKNILSTAKKHGIKVLYKETVSEEEKYELIKRASMLIYPQETKFIGGLSPWEGMFVGKQTIVKDYKVLRELYGDNVHYVNTMDDKSLADKILEIQNYKKEYLLNPDEFSEFAEQEASFKTMASKMLKIFKEMMQ